MILLVAGCGHEEPPREPPDNLPAIDPVFTDAAFEFDLPGSDGPVPEIPSDGRIMLLGRFRTVGCAPPPRVEVLFKYKSSNDAGEFQSHGGIPLLKISGRSAELSELISTPTPLGAYEMRIVVLEADRPKCPKLTTGVIHRQIVRIVPAKLAKTDGAGEPSGADPAEG